MSKKAKALYTLYKMGRITKAALRDAVNDGLIIEEDFNLIVGE
jgi:hypothetical protein